jgi:hypothetical protein
MNFFEKQDVDSQNASFSHKDYLFAISHAYPFAAILRESNPQLRIAKKK